MNLSEVHKAVGKIKGQLFKKSNSHSIGVLKSHFKGSGLQFKEHRVYSHGDDVRFIDWKLVAKMNNPYVKTFEEERNVEITVVLDATRSMFYGHKGVSKLQATLEITCLLFLLAKETKDYIHVIVLGKSVFDIPKGHGEKGIAQLFLRLNREGILHDNGSINLDYQFSDFSNAGIDATIMKHISRNRELIILSGWNLILEKMSIDKILYRKSSYFFRMVAPVDKGHIERLTVKSMNAQKQSKITILDSVKKRKSKESNPRMKELHMEEDYLDQFIKEMV